MSHTHHRAGSATSAANVKAKQRRVPTRGYSEVSHGQLQRDIERGVEYFWSSRPTDARPRPFFKC